MSRFALLTLALLAIAAVSLSMLAAKAGAQEDPPTTTEPTTTTTTEPPTTTTTEPPTTDERIEHATDIAELGLALVVFLLACGLPILWVQRS